MLITIGGKAPLASSGCTIDSPSLTLSCTCAIALSDDGVAGGFARDVERLQNRNAAGDERAERARKTRDRGFAKQIAEKRHAQLEAIDGRAPAAVRADEICSTTTISDDDAEQNQTSVPARICSR